MFLSVALMYLNLHLDSVNSWPLLHNIDQTMIINAWQRLKTGMIVKPHIGSDTIEVGEYSNISLQLDWVTYSLASIAGFCAR